MTSAETIDGGLRSMGRAVGVELALDDDGRCLVPLASGIDLAVEVDEPGGMLHLHGELMRLPPAATAMAERMRLLERALMLNLHGVATDGGTLALDPASEAILLCFWRPLDGLEATAFARLFSAFVDTLEDVRDRLAFAPDEGGAGAAGPSAPDFRFLA